MPTGWIWASPSLLCAFAGPWGSHVRSSSSSSETCIGGARGRMKGERFISLFRPWMFYLLRVPTFSFQADRRGRPGVFSMCHNRRGTHVVGFLPDWVFCPRDQKQLLLSWMTAPGGPLVTPLRSGRWEMFWKPINKSTDKHTYHTSMHSDLAERKPGIWVQLQQVRWNHAVMCLPKAVK